MAVLDAGAERFLESYRVEVVEAVQVGVADPSESRFGISDAGDPGDAEAGMVECLIGGPGGVEIILGAGAVESWPGFAIDQEHVVAFAVPDGAGVGDVIVDSDVVALALGFEEEVVGGVGGVGLVVVEEGPLVLIGGRVVGGGELLVVPSVEGDDFLAEAGGFVVIDVVVEAVDGGGGLVFEGDAGVAVEGHGEVGDEGFTIAGGAGEVGGRVEVIHAPAVPEEVSDGRLDAWVSLTVPIGAEDEVSLVDRVAGAVDGHPDVADDAGAVGIEEGDGLAGGDGDPVVVSTGAVEGGGAAVPTVAEGGNVEVFAHGDCPASEVWLRFGAFCCLAVVFSAVDLEAADEGAVVGWPGVEGDVGVGAFFGDDVGGLELDIWATEVDEIDAVHDVVLGDIGDGVAGGPGESGGFGGVGVDFSEGVSEAGGVDGFADGPWHGESEGS